MDNRLNIKKITQALNYFAQQQPDKTMNKMKAYKLLWLADRYHVRQYGRTITNDTYYALPFGPVPSKTKDILDGKVDEYIASYITILDDRYTYESKKDADLKVFSRTDLDILNLIFDKFNSLNQYKLAEYSHLFPEWKRFEKDLNNGSKIKSYKINTADFFENMEEPSGLFNDDEELLAITSEIYSK